MGGRSRLVAEIIGSADESIAEMMLPDSVDHDACRQRIALAGDGVGQFEPSAAILESLSIGGRENFQKSAWHYSARSFRLTAKKDGRVRRLQTVQYHWSANGCSGIHQFEHVTRFAQLNKLIARALRHKAKYGIAKNGGQHGFPLGIRP